MADDAHADAASRPRPRGSKLRKILLWGLVGLIALFVVMAVIGAMMEPYHVAARRAVYARTPQEIWDVITRFDQSPRWRSDVDAVEFESSEPLRFVEMGPQGPLPLEVTERVEPTRLVLDANDPSLPFTGTWTFELQAVDGGTQLTITERGSVDNPLFRFMARMFMDPNGTADTYLVELGTHLGESVTPQPGEPAAPSATRASGRRARTPPDPRDADAAAAGTAPGT